MTAQTRGLTRGADDRDTAPQDAGGQHTDIDGQRTADPNSSHAELIAEQVRETVVRRHRRAQDSILALVHYGQDGIVMTARMWTASVGRLTPFGGRDAPLLPVPAQAVREGDELFDRMCIDVLFGVVLPEMC